MTGEGAKLKAIGSRSTKIALVVLAVLVLSSGIFFARKSGAEPGVYSNDFNVYYFAAREVMAGRDPYQNSLGSWTPYLYPPLLAELMMPLALLPVAAAAYIWFVVSAVALFAAAWMSASMTARSNARRLLVAAIALAVVARFALDNFNLGQVNTIVAALTVAHVYLYSRERKLASALALALAVSIKLTPAVLLVYHLAKLRLRFAAACAAVIVGVMAVSFLPFGSRAPEAFSSFINRTVKNQQGYDLAYAGNQSLRGAVERLTKATDAPEPVADRSARAPVEWVTLTIAVLLLSLAAFVARRRQSEIAAAAPVVCCMVILSPLSWKAHFVSLILPAAYLACCALVATKKQRLAGAAALVASLALFNLTSPRIVGLAAAEWSDSHSLVFAGALAMMLGVVVVSGRRDLATAARFANLIERGAETLNYERKRAKPEKG